MVLKALRMSSQTLRRDESELTYISERLRIIEDCPVNVDTWRNYVKDWQGLLELRSKISVQRGHAILRCLTCDIAVVNGLGAAFQMLKISGAPPSEVLIMLNEGPVDHIHHKAFQYRQLIEHELFGIRRVRDLKVGAIGLVSGTLVAAMIGFFDNVFALFFETFFGEAAAD